MGVIQRQSIKHTLVTYVAVIFGVANRFFIYPATLTTEELGLITYLTDTAFLIAPFLMLGANSISVRFFPNFRNDSNGHNGLLVIVSLMCLVGFLIFLIIFLLFEDTLFASREGNSLLGDYTYAILPITFSLVFMMALTNYIANFYRIVIPQAISNLTKISVPALAILYFATIISLDWMILGIVLSYFLMLALTVFYLYQLGELTFLANTKFLSKSLVKEMGVYALYGILGGIGSAFVTRMDIYMVTSLTTLANAGIYSIPMMMAGVIEIPTKAINRIAGPILANAWRENNLEEIQTIYRKSSLNLLAVGILLFVAAWANIDSLFSLIPNSEDYIIGKYVFFWLGLGKLADMATGVNNQVVGYSKYFRFNFQSVIFLGVLTIGTNFLLIPRYGIVGAALASAISLAAYNLAKLLFIFYRFDRMQPFSSNSLWVILLGVVAYFIALLVPDFGDTVILRLLHIAVRSLIITALFMGSILYFKLSEDIDNAFQNGLEMVRKWLNG